jgi:hypothetical protein
MKEGGKWELFIPSELSYGNCNDGSSISGGMHLVFHCEQHNNDVQTQFKKPLFKKKSERTTVDRGIIPDPKCSRVIATL